MRVDEGTPIWTLIIYEACLGDHDGVSDVDPRDDIVDKGPKPIKELVKLQLRPKHVQYRQLSRDLIGH